MMILIFFFYLKNDKVQGLWQVAKDKLTSLLNIIRIIHLNKSEKNPTDI